jgi:hypothetical protein
MCITECFVVDIIIQHGQVYISHVINKYDSLVVDASSNIFI